MMPNTPPEPPRRHPPITPRGVAVVVAMVAAFPAALFAVEHPTVTAAALLTFGAVTAVVRRER